MTATELVPPAPADSPVREPAAPAEAVAPPVVAPAADPGALGLPSAIAGGTGLFIVNAGWLSGGATGATISVLIGCTSIGLFIAAVWAAAAGQSAGASVFGTFAGFYASYSVLVLAVAHDWFGPSPDGGTSANETYLTVWIVVFAVMTLVTLRLPLASTVTLVAVVAALVLLLVGIATGDTVWTRLGAAAVFVFVATVAWSYADSMSRQTGGRGVPLGRPVLR